MLESKVCMPQSFKIPGISPSILPGGRFSFVLEREMCLFFSCWVQSSNSHVAANLSTALRKPPSLPDFCCFIRPLYFRYTKSSTLCVCLSCVNKFLPYTFGGHVKIEPNHPGSCGSVDWVLAYEPKGHRFHSRSGHMPGLRARSMVGGTWEVTTHWCFSPSLSPSLPLFLKIKK